MNWRNTIRSTWHGSQSDRSLGVRPFWGASLGNIARTRRLTQIAATFARSGGGTICRVIPDANQAKAAYRLFDRPEVTHQAMTAAHFDLTRRAADERPLT